ncbi:FxLD family lanthipeptide [Nonomuraea sp. NPDC050404]|uniref:FxLD family lanthipeptide n=1 Tax=Nonomuraea sp. NPDC050404 TaxID=3155783 RepID=UPI0033E05194
MLRSTENGYEETGRGRYRHALDIYIALAEAHNAEHLRRRETPEPDPFLPPSGQHSRPLAARNTNAGQEQEPMTTSTIEQGAEQVNTAAGADASFDPFNLDIKLAENTPAANTSLRCGTGDTCGSSCPSACTTS